IDRLRKERRQPPTSDASPDGLSDSHSRDSSPVDGEEIQRFIARLPREQRQAIHLAFFRGMTHSELAQSLQLPQGTVKTRLRLGLAKLRELCMQEIRQR